MSLPKDVNKLVERFRENRDVYRSSAYNETQARREFIDPLFKALGWDVTNEKGYAEAYKEVIHEDTIKVGGATKAPDYCFRIGGTRKFFVEAKRPSVGIKDDPIPAYQLRRYAWSAKLPLSVLTDFEEFAVYDCRVKPSKTDKASAARILYITYTEYAERWDEIALIFSQEAILTGSFDRYVESTKRKKGTAEVDTAFLKEIENWRDVLARNIALRNTELSTRELNFAVQRTIDRLIFLRICEDRGVEEYGQLMALQNGTQIYKRLCQIFRRADERYNSGLFHFRKEKDRPEPPDGLSLNLTIDDKVLKGILKELYYPESPYEFSVLPANILGQVYEQFLGKVIRLTPGHRAVVEDKPEVKKAGGVYYTPTYIVEYIVEHTVGKLLEGKTPNQAAKLRVLDPACGSGSFLLGAYQTLLDWHLKWYSENDPDKHAKGRQTKIFRGPGGDWRLTTTEKKRILLNTIYGVDIDPQAVEVTKLSLLLKVLEGENEETIGQSLRLFHERALPDLADNIKCGNSLIGPDFYQGKQLSLIDEEERYRINAFDWNAEFPHIFSSPTGKAHHSPPPHGKAHPSPSPTGRGQGEGNGFDAVIGNPPYASYYSRQSQKIDDELMGYYAEHFETLKGLGKRPRLSSIMLFIERALCLLAHRGLLGYVIDREFLDVPAYEKSRRYVLNNATLRSIVSKARFPYINLDTTILITERGSPNNAKHKVAWYESHEELEKPVFVPQSKFTSNDKAQFSFSRFEILLRKIRSHTVPLGEVAIVRTGMCMTVEDFCSDELHDERWHPGLFGSNVERYRITWPHPEQINHIKGRKRYFCFDKELERQVSRRFAQRGSRTVKAIGSEDRFLKAKLFVRQGPGSPSIVAAYDEDRFYAHQTLHIVNEKHYNLKYLLGILNSTLMTFFARESGIILFGEKKRPQIRTKALATLPIRVSAFSDKNDQTLHDCIVESVELMLELQQRFTTAKTEHEKTVIQRQIDATDKQIDQLIYELYGLTDAEIRIVEEATK